MPQYSWTCHVCGSDNDEPYERCASCDCPAFATGKEILVRKNARKSGWSAPGPNTKPSATVASVFLFVVSVALFYMFGWYVAGRGAESDFGFIAFVVSILLALISGVMALAGAFVGVWKIFRQGPHNAWREK